jgi:iron(III) transport system substrate-binding protein
VNYEYPVNPTVEIPAELRSWGSFSEDKMPIGKIADLAPDAQKVIDRVGW